MGEVIKEALIIEANGLMVKAFIVENLPKEMIYHKTKKLMPMDEYSERLVPAFELDTLGKRHPTGEMIDTLNPGITLDGAGSGGFIFDLFSDDSMSALRRIDQHISSEIKDPDLKPARQPYAQVYLDKNSPPKAYSQIIRIKLPVPASPPTIPVVEQGGSLSVPKKARKPMTEEQKVAARNRMAAARAKKAQQA